MWLKQPKVQEQNILIIKDSNTKSTPLTIEYLIIKIAL